MRDRMSSLFSDGIVSGLETEDLPKREKDKDNLPLGELDLERAPVRVLLLEMIVDGLEVRMGIVVDEESDSSSLAGDRAFLTSRGCAEVLMNGIPSLSDVMDEEGLKGSQQRYASHA